MVIGELEVCELICYVDVNDNLHYVNRNQACEVTVILQARMKNIVINLKTISAAQLKHFREAKNNELTDFIETDVLGIVKKKLLIRCE